MRFAVIREVKAANRVHREVRLVVDNVPEGTKVDEVMTSLEQAGRTGVSAPPGKVGGFEFAGIPWGAHVVKNASSLPAGTEGLDSAPVESWADLKGNTGVRRVTLRLLPAKYDEVSRAAALRRQPLQKWFEDAIESALQAQAPAEPATRKGRAKK